ncbi:rhodanese-like domain-containing protein [Metabacillus sediminilitoris]|uniref:Rhodanese-like domain-containing protein n=2 Tax=Metabacillus sediminilitoris TaxID=2567941 RepID=A0A4S4BZK4_9BACI|nr:rhodanese-like domain-containing protein [Metabacillus sediminilitoris]THF80710.1 rhodanese-like domain-containing protein [Metabacillus sediminilitoris]
MKHLTEEEFRGGYRKAQLIDVREPNEFEGGHILGARNIPLSQLRQRYKEIRSDQPVYLYCQNTVRSGRAAQMLKRKGYGDLNCLKGGFKGWTGKIKKKN